MRSSKYVSWNIYVFRYFNQNNAYNVQISSLKKNTNFNSSYTIYFFINSRFISLILINNKFSNYNNSIILFSSISFFYFSKFNLILNLLSLIKMLSSIYAFAFSRP